MHLRAIPAASVQNLPLNRGGTVVAWGDNGSFVVGAVDVPAGLTDVVAIAGGFFYSLALVSEMRASPIVLTQSRKVPNGAFQFNFTNAPGVIFTVLGSAAPAAPKSDCTILGSATEIAPGQYQFTDPEATNNFWSWYRVCWP
jgi:hypothetical protein